MSVKQNLLDSELIIAGRIKEDSPMKHSKLIKRSNGNLKKEGKDLMLTIYISKRNVIENSTWPRTFELGYT